jgi:hypothetical protein
MDYQVLPQLRLFKNFLWMVWDHLLLPDPTPVQYDIADYLQDGPRRKIIEAFRGVGKSWITSAYVCWRLYLNPHGNFLVVSASKDRSDQFSTFTKRLINEVPVLAPLKPQKGCRDSNIMFDVGPARASHSPSVKSVGIFGQLTGSRADEIIADDVEVPKNSETQVMRDKLAERVKEFDAVLKPEGYITYLGTPQCEQSLYNILPERGYDVRVWPAQYPGNKDLVVYGERLAPFLVDKMETGQGNTGEPVDPQRFDQADLDERLASYGKSGYALQFLLNTRLSDMEKYPLKVSDLIIADVDVDQAPSKTVWASDPSLVVNDLPNLAMAGDRLHRPMAVARDERGNVQLQDYTGAILAIDPAGRGKDETGYAVVKMLNGFLYVPEAGGLQGGYDQAVLQRLANISKTHKVNMLIVEANFGDGMFTQLIQPVLRQTGYPAGIEEVRHSQQKEKRICDTLEPVMNSHRLVVDPKVIQSDYETIQGYAGEKAQQYSLIYQMTRITRDKGALVQDDRLDALAIGVSYWVDQMAQDAEERQAQHRNDLLEQELEQFMANALGNTSETSGPLWVKA